MSHLCVTLDLTRCLSDEDLTHTVAEVICEPCTTIGSWADLEKNLETGQGVLTITLDGLRYAEAACPEGVAAMFSMFADLNNRGSIPRFNLVAGDDYEPTVYFLQGNVRCVEEAAAREAFVSCWIKQSDAEGAKQVAQRTLSASGWTLKEWSECHEARRDDYAEGTEDQDFFQQSLVDGTVFVFDEWD